MPALAVTPPRPRPAARVWLPLALSLLLHGLLGLAAALYSAGEGTRAGGPIPVDTLVLDRGDGLIILDAPPARRHGPPTALSPAPAARDDEESEAFTATVGEPPVVAPVPATPTATAATPGGGEPSPSGGGGGAGPGTGLLRAPTTARNVVYVIDRSLSMGLSGALAVAKRELLAGIDALPAEARFGVLLYNRQAEPLNIGGPAGLLPATPANRAAVARLVEAVRAEGGTDHLAALRRAVAMGADVIFFVTDADELTAEQVRSVTSLNRGRAAIHAVELNNEGASQGEAPLGLLARLNGGTHRVVPVKR
jgi:hypothetical protein